jgi:hypothetical protein
MGVTVDYEGGHSVRQLQKSWTGVSANLAEMRCDGPLHVDLSAPYARLSGVLEKVGGRFEIRLDGWDERPWRNNSPQSLSLIPRYLAAYGQAEGMCAVPADNCQARFDQAQSISTVAASARDRLFGRVSGGRHHAADLGRSNEPVSIALQPGFQGLDRVGSAPVAVAREDRQGQTASP